MVGVTARYTAAMRSLWDGLCTVSVMSAVTDEQTGRAESKEAVVFTNRRCRVSHKTVQSVSAVDSAAQTAQSIILYIDRDASIPPGSKITVAQNGAIVRYGQSGVPAVYSSHQEIPLELWRGWA